MCNNTKKKGFRVNLYKNETTITPFMILHWFSDLSKQFLEHFDSLQKKKKKTYQTDFLFSNLTLTFKNAPNFQQKKYKLLYLFLSAT